jgi:hypothetical protein
LSPQAERVRRGITDTHRLAVVDPPNDALMHELTARSDVDSRVGQGWMEYLRRTEDQMKSPLLGDDQELARIGPAHVRHTQAPSPRLGASVDGISGYPGTRSCTSARTSSGKLLSLGLIEVQWV